MALVYPRGTIVLVSQVSDPQGRNPKDRFVVVIQDYDDEDDKLFGVAITSTFSLPLPATSIRLPFHNQGRCATGLNRDSVAECTWIVQALPVAILRRIGVTPAAKLQEILDQVQNLLP